MQVNRKLCHVSQERKMEIVEFCLEWTIQTREVADRLADGALYPECHAAGESVAVHVEQLLRHAGPHRRRESPPVNWIENSESRKKSLSTDSTHCFFEGRARGGCLLTLNEGTERRWVKRGGRVVEDDEED
jgi:hypothetical protein